MKNILIVIPDDKLGGSEQVLKNVALFHLQNGDHVNVMFYKRSLSGEWNSLTSYHNLKLNFTTAKSDIGGLFFVFYKLLKIRTIFDRIYTSHLHTTSFIGLLIRLKIVKKKEFIGRESLSFFLRYKGKQLEIFKLLYRLGYSPIDLLICQTDLMKEQLMAGLPGVMKLLNIHVIPNPINLDALKETDNYFTDKSKYIVSAGRLIWDKGYDILVDAFHILNKDYPDLKLIILGEGNCREELERQIENLSLNDKIILPGHVSNVYGYFKNAELCVVSSRIEGFPNVLLQMMSQNNKVVATKCAGGIEELKGVVCANTFDVTDLSNKMKQALHSSEKNLPLFQDQLQERSLKNFFAKIDKHLGRDGIIQLNYPIYHRVLTICPALFLVFENPLLF